MSQTPGYEAIPARMAEQSAQPTVTTATTGQQVGHRETWEGGETKDGVSMPETHEKVEKLRK